jgi:hypothetical protein
MLFTLSKIEKESEIYGYENDFVGYRGCNDYGTRSCVDILFGG